MANGHLGPIGRAVGEGRRHAASLEADRVAEAAGVFEHAVEPQGDLLAERLVDAGTRALVPEHATLNRDLARGPDARRLRHTVDDAAGTTATEDQGVGPLERLDPLEVVQVAVVLDVVADTVHEEVGRGTVPADDDLVAVVLALMQHHTGHVAQDVAHAHHHLVLDERLRHDRHRLRHIA